MKVKVRMKGIETCLSWWSRSEYSATSVGDNSIQLKEKGKLVLFTVFYKLVWSGLDLSASSSVVADKLTRTWCMNMKGSVGPSCTACQPLPTSKSCSPRSTNFREFPNNWMTSRPWCWSRETSSHPSVEARSVKTTPTPICASTFQPQILFLMSMEIIQKQFKMNQSLPSKDHSDTRSLY